MDPRGGPRHSLTPAGVLQGGPNQENGGSSQRLKSMKASPFSCPFVLGWLGLHLSWIEDNGSIKS